MCDMDKDEILVQKRLAELSQTAFHRGIVTFSDFLNLNEQQLLHQLPKNMRATPVYLFGGYISAERCQAAFIPKEASDRSGLDSDWFQGNSRSCVSTEDTLFAKSLGFPISCLFLQPIQTKFAAPLTHRDYLGALLNLGIERHKTGDILVGDNEAHVFVRAGLCDFICENLTKIRHTSVKVSPTSINDYKYEARFKQIKGSVASVRLDALIGLAFNLARGKSCEYIESGKVFINNRLVSSNGYKPQENDMISVRGMGRLVYHGIAAETRKGRYVVEIGVFI